jgi:uncharacterized protein YkwD
MNKSILIGLLLALAVLFAVSCSPPAPPTPAGETWRAYEPIFNAYRAEHNLPPLEFTPELNAKAAERVEEIKGDFRHVSLQPEIIAEGIKSDREALEGWSGSPKHNAIMLDPNYTCTGYARSGGYAVQVFR